MEPTKELGDAIYADKVRRARTMTFDEKLWGGAHLFDEVCLRMRWGILMQFPTSSEQEVTQILHRRIERLRQVEAFACKARNSSSN